MNSVVNSNSWFWICEFENSISCAVSVWIFFLSLSPQEVHRTRMYGVPLVARERKKRSPPEAWRVAKPSCFGQGRVLRTQEVARASLPSDFFPHRMLTGSPPPPGPPPPLSLLSCLLLCPCPGRRGNGCLLLLPAAILHRNLLTGSGGALT